MNKTKNNTNDSNLPLLIIGAVLLAALLGGWWLYSNSQSKPTTKPAATNTNRQEDAAAALERYYKAPPGAQPPNFLGSPTAAVTIEEFADFQCPTCAVVHSKMKEINALYGSRIRFIYRNFPLTQIHKNAYDASVAAEAAGMQGKYWDMQNQLFVNQKAWSNVPDARKVFGEYAERIGLDVSKFQNDMAGMMAKTRVDADLQRGKALGIQGTPTIFLNGRQLSPEQTEVGAIRQFIDAELQKTGTGQPAVQPAANTGAGNTNSN